MQKTLILMQKKKKSKSKEKKTKTKTKEGRGSCLNRPQPVGMVVTMIWDGICGEGGFKRKQNLLL